MGALYGFVTAGGRKLRQWGSGRAGGFAPGAGLFGLYHQFEYLGN